MTPWLEDDIGSKEITKKVMNQIERTETEKKIKSKEKIKKTKLKKKKIKRMIK